MGETETQGLREKPLGDLPTSATSGMAACLAKFPPCFLGICLHCITERVNSRTAFLWGGEVCWVFPARVLIHGGCLR